MIDAAVSVLFAVATWVVTTRTKSPAWLILAILAFANAVRSMVELVR